MLPASFCLRLAWGLLAALLVLTPAQVNPRFYRTHFLTALGLTAAAAVLLRDTATPLLWLALGSSIAACFLGSLLWSLRAAPGGRAAVALGVLVLGAALVLRGGSEASPWLLADDFTSAAVLGAATTAMLLGHMYLIAPGMTLTPLLRLLAALAGAVGLRLGLAAAGLWSWTAEHSLGKLDDVTIMLPLRWGFGFIGPLVLGWMAWQAARIRSTQSATGILYVVVIFCFLGELTSQLLRSITGHVL